MVKQYPHRLVISTIGPSIQDGNGNWVPGTPTTRDVPCRAEPNGRNAMLQAEDGTQVVYDYNVYMALPVETIAVGSTVTLYFSDEVLCVNTVKRFSKGQLNARAWL